MRRIIVATDFSVRSDRAIRRAMLLARAHGAELTMLHVVDEDQPARIVQAEVRVASELLAEQARTLAEIDGLACTYEVVTSDPHTGIVQSGDRLGADLLVIGPHRRSTLKDIFVGTTAERTIRQSRVATLMANAVPAGMYQRLLIGVDLSPGSAAALRAVATLGLNAHASTWVTYVRDPAATGLLGASLRQHELSSYLASEQSRAEAELAAFLRDAAFEPTQCITRLDSHSPGHAMCRMAENLPADLIVVGTHGKRIGKLLLGSVAEEVLRSAHCDVLCVPRPRNVEK